MKDMIHLTARVTPEMWAEIDRLAVKCRKTRSDMVRNLLDVGISVTLDLERVGALRLGLTVRELHDWIKEVNRPDPGLEEGETA